MGSELTIPLATLVLLVALALAAFTILFGTRHLDATERHEGMVAAVAFESVVKLLAFLAVGLFVCYGLFDGMADLFARADINAGSLYHFFPGKQDVLVLDPQSLEYFRYLKSPTGGRPQQQPAGR